MEQIFWDPRNPLNVGNIPAWFKIQITGPLNFWNFERSSNFLPVFELLAFHEVLNDVEIISETDWVDHDVKSMQLTRSLKQIIQVNYLCRLSQACGQDYLCNNATEHDKVSCVQCSKKSFKKIRSPVLKSFFKSKSWLTHNQLYPTANLFFKPFRISRIQDFTELQRFFV